MKKILSIFLAFCVMLTTSITAFATEDPTSQELKKQIDGAVAYLTKDSEGYGVDTATDFCIIADSVAGVSKFADTFLADVKTNLDENGGKIVSSYGENLATYAAVIIAIDKLDKDPAGFYGYDITKTFLAMDPTEPVEPNFYRLITRATRFCKNADEFLETVCDTYISTYYTMGKGVDYYGYSCDNTAYFIDAISIGWNELEKYDDVLDDALRVLDTYMVDGGYCHNPEYGTAPNADSTALALMAHSAYIGYIGDFIYSDILNSIYEDLCTFESSTAGVFTYDGEESIYATKDALMALSDYYMNVVIQEVVDDVTTPDQSPHLAVVIIVFVVFVLLAVGMIVVNKKKKK